MQLVNPSDASPQYPPQFVNPTVQLNPQPNRTHLNATRLAHPLSEQFGSPQIAITLTHYNNTTFSPTPSYPILSFPILLTTPSDPSTPNNLVLHQNQCPMISRGDPSHPMACSMAYHSDEIQLGCYPNYGKQCRMHTLCASTALPQTGPPASAKLSCNGPQDNILSHQKGGSG
jgi:hypothetical protein